MRNTGPDCQSYAVTGKICPNPPSTRKTYRFPVGDVELRVCAECAETVR